MPTEKYPHVNKANKYARDVISGKILACKWVKLACQRQIDDLKKWPGKTGSYYFDKSAAEHKCKFLEMLPHVRGKLAGTLLTLEPWQCFIETTVWGWKKTKDDSRRFTEAYEEVPRKQGKSFRMAGNGLYVIGPERKAGAEVFCGATTQDQAWTVFRPAKQIAERAKGLKEHYGIEVNASNICNLSTGSFFRPLIGKPGDGDGAYLYICDEFHEHDTDEQYDAMRRGFFDPSAMAYIITTAGYNYEGPCYHKRKEVQEILECKVVNDSLFGIIYTLDEGEDWSTVESAIKANPNYGVSVDPDIIEKERLQALRYPRYQTAYKTKRLNIWCGAKDAWMNMEAWANCADNTMLIDDFIGEPYWEGIDLASKKDIASRVWIFKKEFAGDKPHYYLFSKHYVPEEKTTGDDMARYAGWAHEGYLVTTQGNMTDYEFIETDILKLDRVHDLQQLRFDPHNATYLIANLQKNGLEEKLVEVPQNVKHLSEPMKEFEAVVLDGRMHHDNNPVMNWMMSNVVAKLDANDNIYPRKESEDKKIDGPVAGIICMGGAMLDGTGESSYHDQGFVDLDEMLN